MSTGLLVPRADRVIVAENSAGTVIDVLANDVLMASQLVGGSLAVLTPPLRGSVTVLTQGTADVADDRLRYVPPRDWSGSTSLRYRLCEGGSAGRCAEAELALIVRPWADGNASIDHEVSAHSGFRDVTLSGLRALPGVLFTPSPLVAPLTDRPTLAVDATPESPWDAGRAGTAFSTATVPGSRDPKDFRLLMEAAGSADVDLYVGIDRNRDGQPSADELVCTSAMGPSERCEVALRTALTPTVYWTMVHNRAAATQVANVRRYEIPLEPLDDEEDETLSFATTAPGLLAAGDAFALRLGWDDPTLLPGEDRAAWVRMELRDDYIAEFPVMLRRNTAVESAAVVLVEDEERLLRVQANGVHERVFIDVPVGATGLRVTTRSAGDVDLFLARVDAPAAVPAVPAIPVAPARAQASHAATTPSGNETLVVARPAPGRWYVTPVNRTAGPLAVTVLAEVSDSRMPAVRAGTFYPRGRPGQGIVMHPATNSWTAIWYTYLQDGTPTWYYLQDDTPAADGVLDSELYRGTWLGSSAYLTEVGRATFTPTGPDRFTFSYTLDGESGTETFESAGRGCPIIAGRVRDASQHYFDPVRSGSGYSSQFFSFGGGYEFHAAFIYDGRGVPRFLLAETVPAQTLQASVHLYQLRGACPLCVHFAPTRTRVGTLERTFSPDGPIVQFRLDATFTGGVPGRWQVVDHVRMLDPLNRPAGCVP